MPPKKGGPKQKLDADAIDKLVAQANTSEEKYVVSVLPPQKEIILQNLVIMQSHHDMEDAYRRKKAVIFVVVFLLSIIGIIVAMYSTQVTVLFANYPLRWDYFGIGCIFFVPCILWMFWMICPRYKRCCCCENFLWMRSHRNRTFLHEKREERRILAKLTRLYNEGDLEVPPEAREDEELPFEYDPEQPWLYKRWAPKPPIRLRYDEDGVAWIITVEEETERARLEAEELQEQVRRNEAMGDEQAAIEEGNKPRKSSVKEKNASIAGKEKNASLSAKEKYASLMSAKTSHK